MQIVVTLDEMLARKGMTLTELSEAVDLTLANLSILKTLIAICDVLDCQPGDILTFSRAPSD